MRKLILMMSVSLDGYFEGPDRELDWQLVDEELHAHFNEWLATKSESLAARTPPWPPADAGAGPSRRDGATIACRSC